VGDASIRNPAIAAAARILRLPIAIVDRIDLLYKIR
jgi:hypothetical protein